MSIYFPESEEIYFIKTRDYFSEVVSSYSNGNYRSAIVMLYSVAVCDILFKLQELKDMYNDSVATEILKDVDVIRNQKNNLSKSKWEKELIDKVYKEAQLLSSEDYTNLNHLYDHRNFSAHPALNENYELINPSKETTVAHIKNILVGILVKPPVFIKNVFDMLTEDLREKKDIYINEYDKLKIYLKNKYFSKMPDPMRCRVFASLWKICFCLPDDELCKQNVKINRKALQVLTEEMLDKADEILQNEKSKFRVATDDTCIFSLIIYLSHFPQLYRRLNEDVQLHIKLIIEKKDDAKVIAWFIDNDYSAHLLKIKVHYSLSLSDEVIKYLHDVYSEQGKIQELYDYFIFYYGDSNLFDSADERYSQVISPYLQNFSALQLKNLIDASDTNNQIYRRRMAYSTNTEIAKEILKKCGKDFNFSEYKNFEFDKSIISAENKADEENHNNRQKEEPF